MAGPLLYAGSGPAAPHKESPSLGQTCLDFSRSGTRVPSALSLHGSRSPSSPSSHATELHPLPLGAEGHDCRVRPEVALITLGSASNPISSSNSASPTHLAQWYSPEPTATLLSAHEPGLSLHNLESLGGSRRARLSASCLGSGREALKLCPVSRMLGGGSSGLCSLNLHGEALRPVSQHSPSPKSRHP